MDKLVEMLGKMNPRDFSMVDYKKDALYYMSLIPEAKRAGFTMAANDNKGGVETAFYKNVYDLDAAAKFYDIEYAEAKYLFGDTECDQEGRPRDSLFASDGARNSMSRDKDPPGYVAERLRTFLESREKKRK